MNSKPVTTSLGFSAYLVATRFLARTRDPDFRLFFIANHDKISRFYDSCKALAARLDDKNPERREKLKRIFNGPVSVLFHKPGFANHVQILESQRHPLSEEEFAPILLDWALRTMIYAQNYLVTADFNQLYKMINCYGEIELCISESKRKISVNFRCD